MFKNFDSLKLSYRDFTVLRFALDESLRTDMRLAEAFPDEDGPRGRVEALERLIFAFDNGGSWVPDDEGY